MKLNFRRNLFPFVVFVSLFIILSPFLVKGDMSKMQWYTPLDNINEAEATEGSIISFSKDEINKKQGTSSILFVASSGYGEAYVRNITETIIYSEPPDASTLGFYAKFTEPPNILAIWLNGTSFPSGYVGFMISSNNLSVCYNNLHTATIYDDTNITLASLYNTWHWYEIEVYQLSPPIIKFYIDGVLIDTMEYAGDEWVLYPCIQTGSYDWKYAKWWLDYLRIYEGEEYLPYLPSGVEVPNQVDITQIPMNLANFIGIPIYVSGILATLLVLAIAELIVVIFAGDNILIITIVGLLIIFIGVGLTWLPFVSIIFPIVVIGLLSADVFRKWITGHGT